MAKDLADEDIRELCKGSTDPEYYFVRKALEQKVGSSLAEHVSDLLIIKKAANDQNAKQEQRDSQIGLPFVEFLAMPSMTDFKQLVRDGGSLTLKEIKSATVEKLTNKIIRSFLSDVVFYVPFLMLVMLHYRRAALEPETSGCFGSIATWLVAYILMMVFFSLLKLVRIPILRSNRYHVYFWYVLFTSALFLAANVVIFVRGNFAFFGTVTDSACMSLPHDGKTGYNNSMMFALTGLILGFDWLALLGLIQLILFLLMLWALWNGIFKAATKMQEKFSVRGLIETICETIGEGQLQDSLVIGFIQFLLTDKNYHCKICKQNFGEELPKPYEEVDGEEG